MNNPYSWSHYVAAVMMTTSLALAQQAPSTVTPAGGTETIQLKPFEVSSSSEVGYGAQYSNSSSRLNLRYIDVPQTVGVLTSELMNDAFVFDSQEFTKLVPSVQARANSHQPGTFYIRGLQITNTYVDGYIAPRAVNRDRALYDRVEYVKGPASAAMGRGEAGGLVNYISKTPLAQKRDVIDLTWGTDNFYRAELDHSARLTADGRMAYRIPVYFQDSDNPRGGDLMHDRRYGIGPTFRWNMSQKTTLNINTAHGYAQSPGPVGEAYWQNNEQFRVQVSQGQINPAVNWNPFDGDAYVPKERVYGWAGRGRISETSTLTGLVTHKFTDALSFRQGISYSRIDEEYRRFAMSPTALPHPTIAREFQVGLSYMHEHRLLNSTRIQGDLLYDLTLGKTKHQFLVGYDYVEGDSDTRSGQRGGLTQNLYTPDYTRPDFFNPDTYVTTFTTDSFAKNDGFGYFGQYSGSFFADRLNVMYGWRKDQTGSETLNRRNNTLSNPADLKTDVPRYSISYKPVEWMTVYYLHSEQADPRTTASVYTNILPSAGATGWAPNDQRFDERLTSQVTAAIDEIGVKASLLGGKVTAAFAMFEIERDGFILNSFMSEPAPGGTVSFNRNYVVNGEGVRGFEFEVFGQPTRRLTVNASVSSLDGEKPDSSGRIVPIEALVDSASINFRYDFRNQERNGFEVTGGAKLMFKGWVMVPGTYETFHGDQYYIDAGVNYTWRKGRYQVRVRGNNLTDKLIFISGNSQLPLRRMYLSFVTQF